VVRAFIVIRSETAAPAKSMRSNWPLHVRIVRASTESFNRTVLFGT
jgi:hypothetical protein